MGPRLRPDPQKALSHLCWKCPDLGPTAFAYWVIGKLAGLQAPCPRSQGAPHSHDMMPQIHSAAVQQHHEAAKKNSSQFQGTATENVLTRGGVLYSEEPCVFLGEDCFSHEA